MIFQIFFKKKQMLNYSKRLSMRREIQNRLSFQPNPEQSSLIKGPHDHSEGHGASIGWVEGGFLFYINCGPVCLPVIYLPTPPRRSFILGHGFVIVMP
jgi:hypothetical protein